MKNTVSHLSHRLQTKTKLIEASDERHFYQIDKKKLPQVKIYYGVLFDKNPKDDFVDQWYMAGLRKKDKYNPYVATPTLKSKEKRPGWSNSTNSQESTIIYISVSNELAG